MGWHGRLARRLAGLAVLADGLFQLVNLSSLLKLGALGSDRDVAGLGLLGDSPV